MKRVVCSKQQEQHRDEITYVIQLTSWCMSQGLLDMDMMDAWFTSKLDELLTNSQQASSKIGNSSSWCLESYFASDRAMNVELVPRIVKVVQEFVEKVYYTNILHGRFIAMQINHLYEQCAARIDTAHDQ